MTLCCAMTSNAQQPQTRTNPPGDDSQTCRKTDKVTTTWGIEWILDCDGARVRGIGPDHIRAIETQRAELEAANKTVALQADEIASLKKQLDLQGQLIKIKDSVESLRQDQIGRLLAVIGKEDQIIKGQDELKSGQIKKSILDGPKVKFGFTALGAAANIFSIARPPFQPVKGSPCNP
jgi:hypothetical protein